MGKSTLDPRVDGILQELVDLSNRIEANHTSIMAAVEAIENQDVEFTTLKQEFLDLDRQVTTLFTTVSNNDQENMDVDDRQDDELQSLRVRVGALENTNTSNVG